MTGLLERRLGDALPACALATGTLELPGGPRELPLAAPADEDGWRALAKLAAAERLRILPLGHGSKLGWCNPPEAVDLLVSTARFRGIVAYEPGDGTLTARAGTDLATLRAAVRAGGHHLTPAVPRAARASLGGVLAAGQSGVDRLRCGPVRHAVLGTRVLLADGSLAKSGGALVKNVTGYDLHRLFVGSHGTLAVLLEASLRLSPLPDAESVLTARLSGRDEALAAARAVLALPARPLAVTADDLDGGWRLEVLLAGRADLVAWEEERVAAAVPAGELRRGAEGAQAAERARERELGSAPEEGAAALELHLACPPSRLAGALERLLAHLGAAGLAARTLLHPGIATADLRVELPPGADAAPLLGARALLEGPERLAFRHVPRHLCGALDALGPAGPGEALMRRLRDALDPQGLLARGRFHGRL